MSRLMSWAPAILLCVGALAVGVKAQRRLELRQPLASTVPTRFGTATGRDVQVADEELRTAGVSSYLMRLFTRPDNAIDASVYVGYYAMQEPGKEIHSPKNCLPGAGWEVLGSRKAAVATALGTVTVNRYLLQRRNERALVLYWYQGRGRVEASEYAVKWQLLRDSAVRRRSDEALVRIIVPVTSSEEQAFKLGSALAAQVVPTVSAALPG